MEGKRKMKEKWEGTCMRGRKKERKKREERKKNGRLWGLTAENHFSNVAVDKTKPWTFSNSSLYIF